MKTFTTMAAIVLVSAVASSWGAGGPGSPAAAPAAAAAAGPKSNAPAPTARELNLAAVASNYSANLKTFGTNASVLVRPGLVADRASKRVTLQAEATALGPTDPLEFLLIATNSGHDYESLAVSLAKPSDVHEGLTFIGMKPGTPVDRDRQRFWPKGERVMVTFEWNKDGPRQAAAESLVFSKKTGKPLPVEGFVFVGSAIKDAPNEPGKKVYAADAFGPNAIIADFNCPQTVLDVPRLTEQTAAYETQFPNPAHSFATGQLVTVILEPERKDGRERVLDLALRVGTRGAAAAASQVSNLVFRLSETAADKPAVDKPVADNVDLRGLMAAFEGLSMAGREPHVRLEFDDALPLEIVREFCGFLQRIDTEKGIRVGQPPAGHVYYAAFVPNEMWRDRNSRSVQPWEMRLQRKEGKVSATITLIEEESDEANQKAVLKPRDFPAPTPAEARKVFALKREDGETPLGLPTVLMYAPRDMRYGELAPFAAAALETRPYVHVFLE